MIEFNVAAKAEAAEAGEEEDVVEVPIEGRVFLARRPTLAMAALLQTAGSSGGETRADATFKIIKGMMGEEALIVIKSLIWDRRIDFADLIGGSEQNPDGGLIDRIFSEFTGRPTEPSTGSSPSRATGGRRSTGRARGKTSIQSDSPSTGSSTS